MPNFWGEYGHLSAVDASLACLKDLEEKIDYSIFERIKDLNSSPADRYDAMRICRQIEGLQRVVILNGGFLPHSRLPLLYDKTSDRQFKHNMVIKEK